MLVLSFLLSYIAPLLPGEYILPSEQINVIALDTTDGKTSFYKQQGKTFIAYELAFRTEKTYTEHHAFNRTAQVYLSVEKNGCKGLYMYHFTEGKEEKITGRELLPMAYDAIYYHATFNHQPFFYIEKGGKKGFYPPQKDPIYDHLEQVSASFYRFERDGIKGYLDGTSFNEIMTNDQ